MNIKRALISLILILPVHFSSPTLAQSSSCASGLSSSGATDYAQSLIQLCSDNVDPSVGKKFGDAVKACMKRVLQSFEADIKGLSCPRKSAVSGMLARPVGNCGKENARSAVNVGRVAIVHGNVAVEKALLLGGVKKITPSSGRILESERANVQRKSSFAPRAVGSKLSLQPVVRGCCCNYCYQFGGNDRAFCFASCCGSFGACCCY
jgi:hypothetical protein